MGQKQANRSRPPTRASTKAGDAAKLNQPTFLYAKPSADAKQASLFSRHRHLWLFCCALFLIDSALPLISGSTADTGSHDALARGIPSHEIRHEYNRKIQEYKTDEVDEFERKHSRKLVCNEIESCAVCDFAKKCSAFRQSVKHDMRLRGSYLMHAILIVRDAWAYQSLRSAHEFNNLYARKLKKLTHANKIKEDALLAADAPNIPKPSEVCWSLVDGAFRTNEFVNEFADKRRPLRQDSVYNGYSGFLLENVFIYLILAFAVTVPSLLAHAYQFVRHRRQ